MPYGESPTNVSVVPFPVLRSTVLTIVASFKRRPLINEVVEQSPSNDAFELRGRANRKGDAIARWCCSVLPVCHLLLRLKVLNQWQGSILLLRHNVHTTNAKAVRHGSRVHAFPFRFLNPTY